MRFTKISAVLTALGLLVGLAACSAGDAVTDPAQTTAASTTVEADEQQIPSITLSDEGVTTDAEGVYTANDIIYYEEGRDESYGEGEADDAHSAEEAAAHTVVHITKPGTYRVTGKLSAGQLFVDLGEDAESDPEAVVNLILDGADITCTVAPAVFFYRVYECADVEAYTLTPDLSGAGAVVTLVDGSTNTVNGSYVARIYKEGTTKKLHKYDGAFYSKMSMRIEGTDGQLTINAENEGLDSELHLEINGGVIEITSQDDGINTNEDGISVTTVNGGTLTINAGLGSEGDGIDSNGALVINGGTVFTTANPQAGDGGIDADLDIYLNGGRVIACGSRNDTSSSDSTQQFLELSFAKNVEVGSVVALYGGETEVFSMTATREFSSLTVSVPELENGVSYRLTVDGVTQQHGGAMKGGMAGLGDPPTPPDGSTIDDPSPVTPPELPAGASEGQEPPAMPDGETPPDPLDGETPPERPDGEAPDGKDPAGMPNDAMRPNEGSEDTAISTEFTLSADRHSFYNVCDAE